jgi:hypothetical protein
MWLTAQSNTSAAAKFGYYADCKPAGWNYRDNLTGQTLTVDVQLTSGWSRGYLELLIATSYHEASASRPAGDYTLSYRFVPAGTAASRVANGVQGVIMIPVTPAGQDGRCTVTLTPSDDIAAPTTGTCHHVALWDIMSRNGVFLTGNGTNDDHFGQNWHGITNNWFTSVWAASTAEADLLAALVAGRAWSASLSSYRGGLDLLVDGSCPMGSVSVSSLTSRKLVVSATGIPAGGALQVLRGTVDYAGTAGLVANTKVVGTYTASQLASGQVTWRIDTSKSRFVRTQVLNSSGTVIGLSNPVWLLRSAPPGGIPVPRAA